jgi:signal transduction histidine kinase
MNEERKGLGRRAFTPIRSHFGWVVQFLAHRSPLWTMSVSLLLLAVVGVVDYKTGFERSWLVFYLLPVALGTWFVGWRFGVILCALSVTVWILGDIEAGAVYSSPSVPIWNASIAVTSFLVVVWLLHRLHSLLNQLEDRIRQGTADLRQEMKVRERLEKDVTEAAERESQRIGHELHDSLGQHLTATSLALQVLRGKLATEHSPHSNDVDQAVELVEQGIDLTRKIAKGLFPLELEGEGLAAALLELSRVTARNHHVVCELKYDSSVRLSDSTIATHLYRIAQEAVINAIKHGHVSRIVIELSRRDTNLTLSIKDDGIGLPAPLPENHGIGLRIMSSRAGMIGGDLSVKNDPVGGTIVTCEVAVVNDELKNRADLGHVSF